MNASTRILHESIECWTLEDVAALISVYADTVADGDLADALHGIERDIIKLAEDAEGFEPGAVFHVAYDPRPESARFQ